MAKKQVKPTKPVADGLMPATIDIRWWWLMAALIVAGLLTMNGNIGLWDQDEAAYAGFARRMLESGNYLIPEFLWSEPHRKTPLQFWAIALSYQLIGENEWATRLPSTLAILGTIALTAVFGGRLFGDRVGRLAALVLGCSLLVPALAKIGVTDGFLLFFEALAAFSLLLWLKQGQWYYLLLLGIGVACGLLVKGPPVWILAFGMLAGLAWWHIKDWRWWLAVVVTSLSVVPLLVWGHLAWICDNGVFITWLLDWYILKRASGSVWGQTGPPGYFLILYSVSFMFWLPWWFVALKQLWTELKTKRLGIGGQTKLLIIWLLPSWLFYELMLSKLPAYAIAAMPAMAIMIAQVLLSLPAAIPVELKAPVKWGIRVQLILMGLVGLAAIIASVVLQLGIGILVGTGIAIWLWLWAAFIYRSYRLKAWWQAQSFSIYAFLGFFLLVWMFFIPAMEPQRNATASLAAQVARVAAPKADIMMADNYGQPSLLVYLERKGHYAQQASEPKAWRQLAEASSSTPILFNEEKWKTLCDSLGYTPKNPVLIKDVWVPDRGTKVNYYLWVPYNK